MLPRAFLDRPIAHRGLHDAPRGVIENCAGAFRAAIDGRYGIELDVQISRDGHPVVFHDDTLDRLTKDRGPVRARTAAELSRLRPGGGADGIATLSETLALIDGRVPVLVEIKDQGGAPGSVPPLVRAVGEVLRARAEGAGDRLAVMSFNPGYVAALRDLGDTVTRGLTTCAPEPGDDGPSADPSLIAHYDAADARFVSHDHHDLDNPGLSRLRSAGARVLCWTIRTPGQEAAARRRADNITFEGYLPA